MTATIDALQEVEQALETAQPRRYPAYPAYRPSSVDWLGDIPEHWEVKRLKHIARLNPSPSEIRGINNNEDVSFVPMDAVHEYGGLRLDTIRPLEEIRSGFTYFCDGDVLVAKITPCFENGKGSVATGLKNGIAFGTTELHVIRPLLFLYRRFLFYITICEQFRTIGASEMYGAGGQKRVPTDFIRNYPVALPEIQEQQAIARFLDEKTQQIDELIQAKRDLLALLKEKRQAVITHAVTKGLNPDVRLKPSGVDWLGDVPEHWRLIRLGRYTKWSSGEFISKDDYESEASDAHPIPVIGGNGIMGWTDRPLTFHETIVVGRVGALCGNVHYIRLPAWISDNALRLTWHTGFRMPFLAMLLKFIDINRFSEQTAQPLVTGSLLHSFLTPLPSIQEQQAIARFLDEQTEKMDTVAKEIDAAIARLTEYRTALISAAVTGKIDVRGN